MQKKIILIAFGILLIGCTRVQRYDKIVKKGYRNSKEYVGFREKKVEEGSTYYKLDKKIKSTKEPIFYFIEKTEKEAKLYLAINYRAKNWLYMKAIEFVDTDSGESYMLDFYDHKIYKAIWKDNTTMSLKVEEHMAFPLEEEEVTEINKYLSADKIKIRLYSDYDSRTYERELNADEKEEMLEVFDLYTRINKDIDTKLEEALKKLEGVVDENQLLFEELEKKVSEVSEEDVSKAEKKAEETVKEALDK